MTNTNAPDKISELLPFYVNGSLDDDERAMVEAALEANDTLREEVGMLRQVHAAMQSQLEFGDAAPGQAGLTRLLREIETLEATDIPAEEILSHPPANVNAPVRRWRQVGNLAASMVLGVFLGLGLQTPVEEGVAVPASGDVTFAETLTVAVLFHDGVVIAEVTDLLEGTGLIIVDGPSAMGIYRLAAFDLSAPTVEQVAALKARGDIFLHIEGPE